jgi:hypothetical protein
MLHQKTLRLIGEALDACHEGRKDGGSLVVVGA